METRVTEIADGIHQLTTYVDVADFSFNQYLVAGDEPLLFHTGARQLFPLVSRGRARRSSRSSRCAGSASATSRPTSAAR